MKGQYRATLETDLIDTLQLLLNDTPLPQRYRDHALVGDWVNCRDCHIKPDLVWLYQKTNDNVLHLFRLGSHSEPIL